jgi:hypothetical protein
MQKFLLKKAHLNFTAAWITMEKEMLEDEPDHDLLSILLEGNPQDKLDQVMKVMAYDDYDA